MRATTFHAAEIVGRDEISDSRWRGWTFQQECAAFSDAIDQVVDRTLCANMWAVGVSVPLPLRLATPFGNSVNNEHEIWLFLFMLLFNELAKTYPVQNGITFMFDERPEVMEPVGRFYTQAKRLFDVTHPGKFAHAKIGFGPDEATEPLQAADLFAYEWRRRISEKRTKPAKKLRRSYERIRQCRQENNALRSYQPDDIAAINRRVAAGERLFEVLWNYDVPEE